MTLFFVHLDMRKRIVYVERRRRKRGGDLRRRHSNS